MGLFEQFNKKGANTLPEGINLQDYEFKNLSEFVGQEIKLKGYYIHTSKYGKQVTLFGTSNAYPNGVKINLPKRYAEVFEQVSADPAKVDAVLTDKVILTNIKEIDSKNGHTTTFEFKDC